MTPTTIVFPFRRDGAVLLGRKLRGLGEGKWNGFGGKAQEGEDLRQTAVRELAEESGLVANPEDLHETARLEFYFENRPELDQTTSVYTLLKYTGTPKSTDEMEPQWFAPFSLPYEDMWAADKIWLPEVLRGHLVKGKITFAEDAETVLSYEFHEVDAW